MGKSNDDKIPTERPPDKESFDAGEFASSELATALDEIAKRIRAQNGEGSRQERSKSDLSAFARGLLKWRSRIDEVLAFKGLSASPGWCILLDVYAASQEGRPLSISDASISGNTAPTTGLRWVHALEKNGLISREHDPGDARRIYLHLSGDTEAKISYLLSSLMQ